MGTEDVRRGAGREEEGEARGEGRGGAGSVLECVGEGTCKVGRWQGGTVRCGTGRSGGGEEESGPRGGARMILAISVGMLAQAELCMCSCLWFC